MNVVLFSYVLGPLLFIIYINDLPLYSTFDDSLFADDTTLFSYFIIYWKFIENSAAILSFCDIGNFVEMVHEFCDIIL